MPLLSKIGRTAARQSFSRYNGRLFPSRANAIYRTQTAGMSYMKDKERGEELVYFRKEEEKLLKAMRAKKNETNAQDKEDELKAKQVMALRNILNVSGALFLFLNGVVCGYVRVDG